MKNNGCEHKRSENIKVNEIKIEETVYQGNNEN
jgi:hypothetical protein